MLAPSLTESPRLPLTAAGVGGDSHFLAPQTPNPPPPCPKANRTIIYRPKKKKKKMLRGGGPGEARERVQGKMPPLDPEHKLS